MSYYILGSNYELANTDFSSKVSFDTSKKNFLTKILLNNNLADSCIIVSTCNRSEVFVYKKDVQNLGSWTENIREIVFKLHNLDSIQDLKHFYQKINQEACFHLFKVACGLDSLVLGEPQITGQIKDAMSFTENYFKEHNLKIPAEFSKLINETYACAKEVRTRTSIGKYAVSIAYMACKIARTLFTNFENQSILLIGASQTNLLLARHLIRNGITDLKVVNRTFQNAQNFIAELNCGTAHKIEQLPELLENSALVFSSTSSPNYIITYDLLDSILKNSSRKILLFDLAIPSDIEPRVRELSQASLYNRDDLQSLVDINKQKRVNAIQDSLPIIYKYLKSYQEQNRILQGNEIIVEYRNSVHQHRVNLVNEAKQAITRGEDPLTIIENLSLSLTNKILHTPTLMLSSFIKNGQTCQLNEIHTYLDRDDKEFMQEVIDNTLSKEIFKNSCCQDDGTGSFNCKTSPQTHLLHIEEPSKCSLQLSNNESVQNHKIIEPNFQKGCPINHQVSNSTNNFKNHSVQTIGSDPTQCPYQNIKTQHFEQIKKELLSQAQVESSFAIANFFNQAQPDLNHEELTTSFTQYLAYELELDAQLFEQDLSESSYDVDAENLESIVNLTSEITSHHDIHNFKQLDTKTPSPVFNLKALEEQSGLYVPFAQIEHDNHFFNELNKAIHSKQTVALTENAVMINSDLDSYEKVGLVRFNHKHNDKK